MPPGAASSAISPLTRSMPYSHCLCGIFEKETFATAANDGAAKPNPDGEPELPVMVTGGTLPTTANAAS